MKVEIINYTQNAVETLIFTKNTRLSMSLNDLSFVNNMTELEKQIQLEYMVNTIRSSWEFVDFTICIQGVTRAFTHQLVRNRHGSYAQQTMRIISMEGFEYYIGDTIKEDPLRLRRYKEAMKAISNSYDELLFLGASVEDARGVLPTNILTNITAKFNLRTLAELFETRTSVRVQGEYREFMDLLFSAIVEACPWAERFLHNDKHAYAELLQEHVSKTVDDKEERMKLIKAIDVLRKF